MNARDADEHVTVGTEHPAFQAMLKHSDGCRRCTAGVRCITFAVLVKTLREATGKDA